MCKCVPVLSCLCLHVCLNVSVSKSMFAYVNVSMCCVYVCMNVYMGI